MEEAAGSLYSANSGDWRHLIRETGRVSAQSVRRIVNKANPSAREWFLSIICMFELGALKPTKRYLHSLYSHLQRQFRNEKRVCWERSVPAVRCQQEKKKSFRLFLLGATSQFSPAFPKQRMSLRQGLIWAASCRNRVQGFPDQDQN